MKKTLVAVLLLIIPALTNAEEIHSPKPEGFGNGKQGGFMEQLTEEQRYCIEQYGCPKSDIKKLEGEFQSGEKKQRKEMTDKEKAAMEEMRECQKNAFEACGLKIPERPEWISKDRQKGEKGVRPRE